MDLLTFHYLHKKYLRETENMTNMRKVTQDEKQAIADLLGVDIDKIPGEVDWDESEDDDDEDEETEEDVVEEDDEEEDGEESEDDEEPEDEDELEDEDEDEDDEDEDPEQNQKIEHALAEYEMSDKSISLSEYLKKRGL